METEVAIIGLGPAGLQAAIHAARKKVKVIAIGRSDASALNRAEIENYLGILSMKGTDLLAIGREQATRFGAQILEENVMQLSRDRDMYLIRTDKDNEIHTRSVILAIGMPRAKLNIPGEKEFLGKGVSYCASCDAGFFKSRPVAIIGDESEAAESAMLLTEYASEVYWISPAFKVTDELMNKVKRTSVKLLNGKPVSILGDKTVSGLDLADGKRLDVKGIFVALGARSALDLAMGIDLLPEPDGRIPVDAEMRTSVDMVFACGDITGQPWQLARSVGQGCIAGDNAAKAVRERRT